MNRKLFDPYLVHRYRNTDLKTEEKPTPNHLLLTDRSKTCYMQSTRENYIQTSYMDTE